MMYDCLKFEGSIATAHDRLAVAKVSCDVLDQPGVVIADQNAATPASFHNVATGLAELDPLEVFAPSWDDPNPIRKEYLKRKMMAEALIPGDVAPDFIQEIHLCCTKSRTKLGTINKPVVVNRNMFFNFPGWNNHS